MSTIVDPEAILSINEEWTKLEEEWGIPVDLETEEDCSPSKMKPVFSSLDLRKTTFDSSFLLKKVRRKVGRQLSKTSDILNYKEFLQDLEKGTVKERPVKQFYYINGQIISAMSVEDICDKIDDIFKSVDKLSSATSTIRLQKKIPERVSCSISTGGLSFDDTEEKEVIEDEKEKSDGDDLDRFIDEAFEQLCDTMATLSEDSDDEITRVSVTTLVKRFSNILNNPAVKGCARRKRKCSDRFKELAEFWNGKAFDKSE